jgi:hypothetical protein
VASELRSRDGISQDVNIHGLSTVLGTSLMLQDMDGPPQDCKGKFGEKTSLRRG